MLDEDEGGTRLRLRHSRLGEAGRPGHNDGWRYFLGRLTEAVAAA